MTEPRHTLGDTADRVARSTGIELLYGRPTQVRLHRRLLRETPTLAAAVREVSERVGADPDPPTDRPVFILSAGWRSGSTLLQRLVVSAREQLVWGEPYHRCEPVQRLADSLLPFATGWPPESYVYAEQPGDAAGDGDGDLSSRWIANLYPPLASLVAAHRAFFRTLFDPAAEHAGREWGMKEVRLSGEHALYLRLLFPDARFLLLVRDPETAYRSYRERPGWYESWPGTQVRTPKAYGRMWCRLAASFVEHEQALGATLVRYEDLVPGSEALDRLDATLGAPVDREVLGRRVGSTAREDRQSLSAIERRLLADAVAPIASRFGYAIGGESR